MFFLHKEHAVPLVSIFNHVSAVAVDFYVVEIILKSEDREEESMQAKNCISPV